MAYLRHLLTGAALLVSAAGFADDEPAAESAPQRPPLVVTRLAMGVKFQIALVGNDDEALTALAMRGFAEVDRLEAALNNWSADSGISQLNQSPGTDWIEVPTALAELLLHAQSMRERTGGAYDVTVLPALRLYGFDDRKPHRPTESEQQAILATIGGGKLRVRLDPPGVARSAPGMEIDVSSAAKGMAIDAVVAMLRKSGVTDAFVVASGSTVYAIGSGPGGRGWPFFVSEGVEWRLSDEAVSTSGRSWRDIDLGDRVLSHIFDPRVGRPAKRGVAKACFRGPSAIEADMASTALVVLGEEDARAWFKRDEALDQRTAWLELSGGRTITLSRP